VSPLKKTKRGDEQKLDIPGTVKGKSEEAGE